MHASASLRDRQRLRTDAEERGALELAERERHREAERERERGSRRKKATQAMREGSEEPDRSIADMQWRLG